MKEPVVHRDGLTLIELLAVIVIASLVLGVAGWSVSATSDRTVLARTIAGLQDIDARARLHARSSGEPVVMHINGDARVLRLTTVGGEKLSDVSVPSSIEMVIEKDSTEPSIAFDARGRSCDYVAVLRTQHEVVRLRVHGLSGEVALLREART